MRDRVGAFVVGLLMIGALGGCAMLGRGAPDGLVARQESGAYALRSNGATWLRFRVPAVSGTSATVDVSPVEDNWWHVRARWQLDTDHSQDELSIPFSVALKPDFWWSPHLAPEEGNVIAQHVFRSPAIIAAQGPRTVIMIPDLERCGQKETTPWFMDLNAPDNTFTLGMSRAKVSQHVGFRKVPGMVLPAGTVELAFFVTAYTDDATPSNPWDKTSGFLWSRYGHGLFERGDPVRVPMDRYVDHVYRWAFDTWGDAVWQEFDVAGTRVGAPAFIVNVTQSPNYPGEANLREFLSVWNQAWFSSMRSASGVFRYARRSGNEALAHRARLTKELALAAPMRDGIFPSVYRTEMHNVEIDGKGYTRSKGWDTGYWTNSNRTPRERGVTDAW